MLFVTRQNWLLLKIKNSTVLIIFEMISLKWVKSLTNFYWLEENLGLPELYLKQPRFTYGACGPFTKHHERIQKYRETVNLKHSYIYKKTSWPYFEEAVYFLPLSFQKFLVLILPTSEGWKAESTLEPPSGFEHGITELGIQHLNH